ncbi:MAG: aldo/keto reductase [Defluviitaleaceae bacterium]|nr:aldo/keto reductase [Defluviitaleaceae bacterium]
MFPTEKDYLTVGKSFLGFGAMRMPNEKETARMIDVYLDGGGNYFDTAWIYGGSEEMLRKTLVSRHSRSKFFVADKLPPWEVKNHADCDNILQKQFGRTGLDYFDFYLIHSLSDEKEKGVNDMGLFEWGAEQKKKGLIRHLGFSFHGTTEYLSRLLQSRPEAEFVQLQLNYKDIMCGNAGEWQALAIKHNVPIIVMEPVRGGALAALPPSAEKLLKDYAPERSVASWAIQYAATLQGVTCVLSGMSTLEQVQDNLKTFRDLKPMTAEEIAMLENVMREVGKISSVPCTACKYCDCPVGIDIPTCFLLYNDIKRGSGTAWNLKMMYNTLPEGKRASDCVGCGACVRLCPQKINIPEELGRVRKEME